MISRPFLRLSIDRPLDASVSVWRLYGLGVSSADELGAIEVRNRLAC